MLRVRKLCSGRKQSLAFPTEEYHDTGSSRVWWAGFFMVQYQIAGQSIIWIKEREFMDSLYLVVGLGNPGKEYAGTRHNMGFDVIDHLADEYNTGSFSKFGKSLAGKGMIGDCKVILLKPQTYMNLSGEAVREAVDFYKIDHKKQLIVVSDDIDLPEGKLRLRMKGSAGGHNGLKNIILHLGDDEFYRIRVGVGAKPDKNADLADYVLGHPGKDDRKILEEAQDRAAQAVRCIMEEGIQKAMNQYN